MKLIIDLVLVGGALFFVHEQAEKRRRAREEAERRAGELAFEAERKRQEAELVVRQAAIEAQHVLEDAERIAQKKVLGANLEAHAATQEAISVEQEAKEVLEKAP